MKRESAFIAIGIHLFYFIIGCLFNTVLSRLNTHHCHIIRAIQVRMTHFFFFYIFAVCKMNYHPSK